VRTSIRAFFVVSTLLFVGGGVLAVEEMRSSRFQARFFTPIAQAVTWRVEPGPAPRRIDPGAGPYDLRTGYHARAARVEALRGMGFEVVEEARVSEGFRALTEERGLFPIYSRKLQTGLEILDRDGASLFRSVHPESVYGRFEDIPPVVWQTLLYIENRTALDPTFPQRNPAVEWGRFLRSALDLGLRMLGREGNIAGASTLATQIEKFHHAPEGRTETPVDKLRQMATASLRAYQGGEETLEARQQIVRDYLNSVPLAAIRNEGEVTGVAEGLRAWYGADFTRVNDALHRVPTRRVGAIPAASELGLGRPVLSSGAGDPAGEMAEAEVGRAYRQVLSLLLSQRRPTWYLTREEGRVALARLTDRTLAQIEEAGLIPVWLARAAQAAELELRSVPPNRPTVSFVERKAVNTVRTALLSLLEVPGLYELDRLDLTVRSTIDAEAQATATRLLDELRNPDFIQARGLDGFRLLDRGDPAKVVYSIAVHERTPMGNQVRIQVDNLEEPFNLNESARLELGSTAKLRTLVTYLEVLAELHGRFGPVAADSLGRVEVARQDRLSQWARDRRRALPEEPLDAFLRAGMARRYSASPTERFGTGGGVQTFSNFDRIHDRQTVTVTEAFRQSINLPFVRIMQDLVQHFIYRMPGSTAHVLEERGTPLRQEYLERFADREGIQFLNQFIPRYRGLDRAEILEALFQERRLTPQRMAWAYRAVVPDGTVAEFEAVLRQHLPEDRLNPATLQDAFRRADPAAQDLADLGYLSQVHPLDLWAARFFLEAPGATAADAIAASREARQEVYRWLFRTSRAQAQDARIRALLEVEAFSEIHARWRRVGYPFQNLVPSLGTSIGSSGDRPAALNELVGIILNDGVRQPTHRVEAIHLAPDTPFSARLERRGDGGERVLDPEVARILREAMIDVVENGTARRARGSVRLPDGTSLPIGGKTGTGDNRYRVFAPGGRLLESRAVNRTSTLVFFVGDRYYGVISAYVPGEASDAFGFTSALPAQILRELGPALEALLAEDAARATSAAAASAPREERLEVRALDRGDGVVDRVTGALELSQGASRPAGRPAHGTEEILVRDP
jgi:membrane peptidoglycan carboxypeptidase